MLISDIFKNLSYGSLSNLRIGGSGSGTIPTAEYPKLIHHINRGLTALHTRFFIKADLVTVRAYDGKTLYPLLAKYADNNATVVDQKFIADSPDHPFKENVIKITVISTEDCSELPLNDSNDERSLFTPSPQVLQIPKAVTGDAYFLYYQANHGKLLPDGLEQEVDLPPVLQEPLEMYVASKVLSNMNGQEHAAKGLELYQQYELYCKNLEDDDLLSTSILGGVKKFAERGFV